MATKYASNSSTLLAALKTASGGDRIVLAAGNYGNMTLANQDFGAAVTLAGAGKATFTGLALRNVGNLILDDLVLDYVPGRSASAQPFTIDASRKITVRNSDFDGHLSGGYGGGFGLKVTKSANITLENSGIAKFATGAAFLEVTDLVVRGNDMRLMGADTMVFAQAIRARIENNHLHDMQTPPDRLHKDLIQFWSTNTTKPSSDVVIRGNVLESDEPLTHGIFVGNEIGRTNKAFKYQNIVIENNKIVTGHVLGLAVEHANKVVIRGNDVRIHPDLPKTSMNTPVIKVTTDSTGVTIAGNTVHSLSDLGAGWSVTGNSVVTGAGTVGKAPAPVTVDKTPAPDPGATGGGSSAPVAGGDGNGDDFRFTGSQSKGKTDKLAGFSFADGDRIVLIDYAAGTLKGQGWDSNPLAVNNVGTYAVLDARADLTELVAASPGVTLTSNGSTLVLGITQPGGRHDIHLPEQAKVSGGSTGSGGAPAKAPAPAPAPSAGATDFRFTGSQSKGKTDKLAGVDLDSGDRIVLIDYAAGTLKGQGWDSNPLAVNDVGTYAVLDATKDIAELVSASPAVSVRTAGDTLVLSIAQAGGRHDIHLAGLADDFLAL